MITFDDFSREVWEAEGQRLIDAGCSAESVAKRKYKKPREGSAWHSMLLRWFEKGEKQCLA